MKHPTISAEARQALRETILHWERFDEFAYDRDVDGLLIEEGKGNALCKLYVKRGCTGCPVRDETGKRSCLDTPYHEAADLLYATIYTDQPQQWEGLSAAIDDQIRFLMRLEEES